MKKWILVFVPLLIYCGGNFPGQKQNLPQAAPVEGLTVSKGQLISEISSAGTVDGINKAFVVSETSGIIRAVSFEIGDQVTKGQLLVQVDEKIAQLTMQQAKEVYQTASINLEAKEQSYKSGNLSKIDYVRAQSDSNGAKAAYERALKSYEDCFIRAPISGFIVEKRDFVTLGNYLQPGLQLANIVDISYLKVEIALGEREIGLISKGLNAFISVPAACRDEEFTGTVFAVSAGADSVTGGFAVLVTWPNSCEHNIKSGMSAIVRIVLPVTTASIIIPAKAISSQDGKFYVFVARDGLAEKREVVLGEQRANKTAIVSGLKQGEIIIISKQSVLRDKDPVTVNLLGESSSWE